MSLSFDNLKALLKTEPAFVTIDGEVNTTQLHKLAQECDRTLLKLLLSDRDARETFFLYQGEHAVFVRDRFIDYIQHKNFLANSYTKYKNRIGLHDGDEYIKKNKDVVLSFPFKDCVLEGGQTKDDAKRQEHYYNKVLACEEIDRLLDPKVLSNATRYTREGTEKPTDFARNPSTETITDNLIIKGNNLIALHTLKSEFARKVKLIYIDPPYNTGNDSFHYNDNFNHSTWLVFMKNRLEASRELLREDGVIFVQIDNSPSTSKKGEQQSSELGYLYVLLDEIFGRKNYITSFVWKKKGGASNTENNIGTITESVLMYSKNFNSFNTNLQEHKRTYKYKDEEGFYNLEEPVKTNDGGYERKTMVYTIHTPKGSFNPPENKRWTLGKESIKEYINKEKYEIIKGKFYIKRYKDDYSKGEYKLYNNLLLEQGSLKLAKNELKLLGFEREDFDTPKPEALLQRVLEIATQPNDIVLDYHLGSGTTAAVAHKMHRQYIGIEQMDYIESIAVERLKKVIDGEQGGISKTTQWQGGGSFIYMELKKHNQTFIDRIAAATTSEDLVSLKEELLSHLDIDYRLDTEAVEQTQQDFAALKPHDQKKVLIDFLELNQLYVPYTELNDVRFACTDTEKALSKAFYTTNNQ